jgi:hypothetical protein
MAEATASFPSSKARASQNGMASGSLTILFFFLSVGGIESLQNFVPPFDSDGLVLRPETLTVPHRFACFLII